jgi:hypothetical protein
MEWYNKYDVGAEALYLRLPDGSFERVNTIPDETSMWSRYDFALRRPDESFIYKYGNDNLFARIADGWKFITSMGDQQVNFGSRLARISRKVYLDGDGNVVETVYEDPKPYNQSISASISQTSVQGFWPETDGFPSYWYVISDEQNVSDTYALLEFDIASVVAEAPEEAKVVRIFASFNISNTLTSGVSMYTDVPDIPPLPSWYDFNDVRMNFLRSTQREILFNGVLVETIPEGLYMPEVLTETDTSVSLYQEVMAMSEDGETQLETPAPYLRTIDTPGSLGVPESLQIKVQVTSSASEPTDMPEHPDVPDHPTTYRVRGANSMVAALGTARVEVEYLY